MYNHLWTRTLRAVYLGFFIYALPYLAHANVAKEQDIKAAYLFNLGSYIEWPDVAFADVETAFKVCVVGATPVTNLLESAAQQRKINNRKTDVLELSSTLQNVEHCHLLFIAHSAQALIVSILERVKGHPVLTVSEAERFIQVGGMIEFYLLDNRVRLAIAPESMTDAGLHPSSQLMRVAKLRSRQ